MLYTALLSANWPNTAQSGECICIPWRTTALSSVLFCMPMYSSSWQLGSQLFPPKNNCAAQMWIISAWTRTNFSENCTYCRTNWVCYGRSQNNCSGDHRAYPAVNSLFVPARSQDRNSRQGGSKQGTNSSVSGSICSDKGLLPSRQGCKTPLQALTGGKNKRRELFHHSPLVLWWDMRALFSYSHDLNAMNAVFGAVLCLRGHPKSGPGGGTQLYSICTFLILKYFLNTKKYPIWVNSLTLMLS